MRYNTTQDALRALDAGILDSAFNLFTLKMASGINYKVVPHEPYANLDEMKADYQSTGVLLITSRFDQNSIYGDPSANHAARAWHDWAHLCMDAPFDAVGESLAAEF